jgi:hypothetical protein
MLALLGVTEEIHGYLGIMAAQPRFEADLLFQTNRYIIIIIIIIIIMVKLSLSN